MNTLYYFYALLLGKQLLLLSLTIIIKICIDL